MPHSECVELLLNFWDNSESVIMQAPNKYVKSARKVKTIEKHAG